MFLTPERYQIGTVGPLKLGAVMWGQINAPYGYLSTSNTCMPGIELDADTFIDLSDGLMPVLLQLICIL